MVSGLDPGKAFQVLSWLIPQDWRPKSFQRKTKPSVIPSSLGENTRPMPQGLQGNTLPLLEDSVPEGKWWSGC